MERIVIVTKKSRLQELVLKHHTESAAKFLLESSGQSLDLYKEEDATYANTIKGILGAIPSSVRSTRIDREDLPDFLFRASDVVIICGPDGLFANTAKYIWGQTVVTVNPDPTNVTGVLMLFSASEVGSVLASLQKGECKTERLPFIKAVIGGDKVLWGINDVFIGRKDQISARYTVTFNGRSESQSSSGIIVSTGVGSTGWMNSVQAMITGIVGDRPHKLSNLPEPTDAELAFVVREPFKLPSTGVSIVTGRITPGNPLIVSSEMPNGGYIFSDGVTEKALFWNAGDIVTVTTGDRYIQRAIK